MNTTQDGRLGPKGDLQMGQTRDLGPLQVRKVGPLYHLRNWVQHRRRELPRVAAMRVLGRIDGVITLESRLQGVTYRRPAQLAPWQARTIDQWMAEGRSLLELPRFFGGHALDFGTLSTRVVTTAGVGYLVDALQGLTEPENLRYHGYGTGTNAEANGDTGLQTELTTQYATDNTRPTGTLTENAANIFETVATLSPDTGGTIAVTEHGILSQAATGGGTLLDRSVFSAVNVVAASDSLQTTYRLTISAGG